MTKSFKGEYIPFSVRLVKRLAPVILMLLFVLFKIYYGRTFSGNLAHYRIYFLLFAVVCLLIGIYFHTTKIRTIVNEIRFTDTTIHIIGQDFNSKYEDQLDSSKTMLEIQEEKVSKYKTRLCLEIYCDDKYYYLNKFNDWQYATLAKVIDEYQSRTGKSVAGMLFYSQLKESK